MNAPRGEDAPFAFWLGRDGTEPNDASRERINVAFAEAEAFQRGVRYADEHRCQSQGVKP